MSAEDVARDHYAARKRLIDAAGDLAAQSWAGVSIDDLDGSWARVSPHVQLGVAGAQLAAARTADTYTDAALDAQGAAQPAEFEVTPESLAGVASDGRPLDSLLRNPITVVKAAIGAGVDPSRAMAAGYANLDMIVRTQVADAGRVADGLSLAAHREARGYRRMLQGASCSRCIVLAGRWYAYNAGFLRHPRCRPGATAYTFPRRTPS